MTTNSNNNPYDVTYPEFNGKDSEQARIDPFLIRNVLLQRFEDRIENYYAASLVIIRIYHNQDGAIYLRV